MTEARPYAQHLIGGLETLFASGTLTVVELHALAEELPRRSSPRADTLLKRVLKELAILEGAGRPGAGPAAHSSGASTRNSSAAQPAHRAPGHDAPDPASIAQRFGPVLDRVRKRLLDLTASNALLNYRHPRASSLRIVDEVPAQVFEVLLADEGMTIVGLPDPDSLDLGDSSPEASLDGLPLGEGRVNQDADEATSDLAVDPREVARAERKAAMARRESLRRRVAEHVGINSSLELPAAHSSGERHHHDRKLQTLLFPTDLEEQLRKIRRVAETVIEETGANRLHLMFGFIEWHEAGLGESERVLRQAPLVLLPVRLRRGNVDKESQTFRYVCERTGEEWSANVSLQEKCRADFGLVIPDVDEASDETLEHYFARVEDILRRAQPTWRLRRFLTLGLVSFGKVLMWRDLDPRNWPANRPLFANQALRELLGADAVASDESPAAIATDYPLDRLAETDPAQVPPTVIDADSSQHSALVDVARGLNLVLQGPPGTGKSQTIANLIAAALGAGKRVLFVAEKKAALDVVHRRLKGAELGEYCLALHSHTSAKKEFIGELAERIEQRGAVAAPRQLADCASRHRDARSTLNAHVERMHEPLDVSGLTPFAVFWRARRLSAHLNNEKLAAIRDVRLAQVVHATRADVHRRRDLIVDYAGAFRSVCAESGAVWRHPWSGVSNPDLTFADVNDLLDQAHAMAAPLSVLRGVADDFERLVGGEAARSAQALRLVCATVQGLIGLSDIADDDLPGLIVTASDVPHVQEAVAAVEHARECWSAVAGPWGTPGHLQRERAQEVRAALTAVQDLVGGITTHGEVRAQVETVRVCLARLTAAASAVDRLGDALGHATSQASIATVEFVVMAVRAAQEMSVKFPQALVLRSEAIADPAVCASLERLSAEADTLRSERNRLDARFLPSLRPSLGELHVTAKALAAAPRFLPWLFSSDYRRALKAYRVMSGGVRMDRRYMTASVVSLIRHLDHVASFEATPDVIRLFGPDAATIDSPFDAASAVAQWRLTMRQNAVALGESGRLITETLWTAPAASWAEAFERMRVAPDAWDAAQAIGNILTTLASVQGLRTLEGQLAPGESALADVAEKMSRFVAACDLFLSFAADAQLSNDETVDALAIRLRQLADAWNADDVLDERAGTLASLGIPFAGHATDVAPLRAALQYVVQVEHARLPRAVRIWLLGPGARLRLSALQQAGAGITTAVDAYEHVASGFADSARLDQAAWGAAVATGEGPGRSADALFSFPVEVLQDRLAYALTRDKALHPWAIYRHSAAEAVKDGLETIVELVEREVLTPDEAADGYEAIFFRSLAEAVLRKSRELDHFDSGRHGEVQRRFADLDGELQRLTRREISSRLSGVPMVRGNPGPRVTELTEDALLKHQIGLQRRHAAIRELFRRAGRSILALKPCFLMGPQAVAQYLQPGLFEFDLVVMDEASQMRPEDALGAIARGRQIIVVGDPMQLGPTRFFDKLDRADDDENDTSESEDDGDGDSDAPAPPPVTGATVLERSESILTAAATRYGVRMLRWHYRSRHPKLIAFSNREFYHERLIIFPTSGATEAHDGVFLRRVNGLYGARRNVPEAQAIVAAVRNHAKTYPERSLLVASMNFEQADLLDSLIGQAEKEDPSLAAFLARHEEGPEPFAIKNLENVQGDERDVIYVSVTYGPNAEGRLIQKFGPIIQAGGERRLNVLFTRAKHRLEVFCSFDPNDLRVADSSARGLRVLRDYLKFAAGETWWAAGTESGREPDSDFEIAIAMALSARGYETRPQIGVAGYFVDMAVVDPDHPGRFILGIEADGATYHSAKTARDRDRLRQAQLEALGWTIHRVWSTDFFRDPEGQINRVVSRIEGLRSASTSA